MSDGWAMKSIGELCEAPKLRKAEIGAVPYIEIGDVNVVSKLVSLKDKPAVKGSVLAPANSLLVSRVRPTRGAITLLNGAQAVSSAFLALQPRAGTNLRLLFYWLAYSVDFRTHLEAAQIGSLYPSVREEDILKYRLRYPIDPAEQQRIVRLLEEAFEEIAISKANAEKNLQNAEALFESHIEKVLSIGGTGWRSEQLGQVCEIERGGSPRPIQRFLTSDPAGVNWIKIGDATASGKYIFKTEEKIRVEGVKSSRMVNEGDFLLSNSMSFGRPYIMKTTGCIHDGWLVLRKPSVNADFLYHALSSKVVFNQFNKLAAGSTVRNLNIGLAKSVWIPIPPLAEQAILAKEFDELQVATDVLAEIASRKAAKITELGSAILHEAFSGNRRAA